MKRFITTIKNIFSIEELKNRILFTLGLLIIFRLGSYIVLPGLDPTLLSSGGSSKGILGLLDTLLGGAFSRASIFALGIMPYISASIVIQLLTVAVPYFQKMQKEGESGRKKMNQITRVLTILITLVQSSAYIAGTIIQPQPEAVIINRTFFTFSAMIILTAGTIFCMWMGERITEKGIGNGISMLIMIGIVSRFPAALIAEGASRGSAGLLLFLIELVALFFVVMGVVLVTQAVRRIPVQYAKQIAGSGPRSKKLTMLGAQRSYLPLKINAAGVMPIIFAQSLMFLPSLLASTLADRYDWANYIATTFSDFTSWQYNLLFAILIVVFTFFYTAIIVNPTQLADEMKRNGGFIPGVKPGEDTANYISHIIDRITLPGALFLAVIAILPAFASIAGINMEFAQFYGGTSLLIMVGVILDTLQQIESFLLMRHYEGMMKTGKVKGRTGNVAVA
ncbi:MAG: preprotein translocase subunit SecY [Cytophagales bacterium]|nr:preprotein translocase subunit SecY [Bernardetiaceae bacterium]MDW8209904.1 preprotein translocase subunit SecY [Cytophagales bacterium]